MANFTSDDRLMIRSLSFAVPIGESDRLVATWEAQMAGRLSTRETQVLTLAASGLSYKQIAAQLGISALTARNHLTNIYSKLGIHDRAGAALTAVRLGLVEV